MLKVTIVILLLANFASWFTAGTFLFKDQGETKRTFYALGLRISLALLLMGVIVYGVLTGQLGMNAPWHDQIHPESSQTTP